jgi:hypothetical protein
MRNGLLLVVAFASAMLVAGGLTGTASALPGDGTTCTFLGKSGSGSEYGDKRAITECVTIRHVLISVDLMCGGPGETEGNYTLWIWHSYDHFTTYDYYAGNAATKEGGLRPHHKLLFTITYPDLHLEPVSSTGTPCLG